MDANVCSQHKIAAAVESVVDDNMHVVVVVADDEVLPVLQLGRRVLVAWRAENNLHSLRRHVDYDALRCSMMEKKKSAKVFQLQPV